MRRFLLILMGFAFALGMGMEVGQYLTFVVMNRLGVFGIWGGY